MELHSDRALGPAVGGDATPGDGQAAQAQQRGAGMGNILGSPWRAFMKHQQNALTRSTQVVSKETRKRDLFTEETVTNTSQILWIDGVGGFQLIQADDVVIGQAVPSARVDIAIVGDLSRQACAIRRASGDYVIQPLQPMKLNDQSIDRSQLLVDGGSITLGERVRLLFRKPSPLSSSAMITMESLNRFKPAVDGILLLADSCIIGPNPSSHIHCPNWDTEVLLFKKADQWVFRVMEPVDVDGTETQGHIELRAGLRVRGEAFSFSVE